MWDVWEFLGSGEVEGRLLTAKHLLHVETRGSIDTLLARKRLRPSPRLRRVARGIYYVAYRRDPAEPEAERIAALHAEARGELLQIHGADAARGFGIDAPAATGPRFYTSGPTRDVALGRVTARYERVPGVILLHPGTEAGAALAALHHGRRDPAGTVAAVQGRLGPEARELVTEALLGLPQRTVEAWVAAVPGARVALPERVERAHLAWRGRDVGP